MDSLPLETIHAIATVDLQTYHALVTAYPRYSRSIPPVPTVGYIDRFDMMIYFGFDVHVKNGHYIRCIEWTMNGVSHMNVLPAVIFENGSLMWYQHGRYHRDGDLPAKILSSGMTCYMQRGHFHRDDDKPAVIHADGAREWYKRGFRQRNGDLPAVISRDDRVFTWYNRGLPHRENGLPAMLDLHRDKPCAIHYANGKLCSEIMLTESERIEYLRELHDLGCMRSVD